MDDAIRACLRKGDTQGAQAAATAAVKAQPAEGKRRIALFQLLCVHGAWERALGQLDVIAQLDAQALPMVGTYREAIRCEAVRAAVFAGKATPLAFGEPRRWLALMVEALHAQARGDHAAAARLRDEALGEADAAAGTCNGEPFEWIADADTRLGPVLEAIVNGKYYWMPFAALAQLDELEREEWTREDTIERLRAAYQYRKRRFAAQAGKIEDDGYEDRSLAYQQNGLSI